MSDKEKILGIMAGFDLILSPENYEKGKESMNKQCEEKDKEIKRLKKRLEEAQLAYLAEEEKNKKLHSIIKEVREYIEPLVELDNDIMLKGKMLKPVIEILDKGE